MIVSASANHLKVRTSDTDFATLSVANSDIPHFKLLYNRANAGFTVDAPGTVVDSGNGEVRIEKDSQGMLLVQGNAKEYIACSYRFKCTC